MTARLTPRRRRILVLVANGYTNEAIARREGIAAQNVGRNIQQVVQTLGANGRSHAVAIALTTGILHPADITQPDSTTQP